MKRTADIVRFPVPESIQSCDQSSVRLSCDLDSENAEVATGISLCMSLSLDAIMNSVEMQARNLVRLNNASDTNAYVLSLLSRGGFQMIFKTIKDSCATPYGDNYKFAQDLSTMLFWSKLSPLEKGLNDICASSLEREAIRDDLDRLCIKYVNTTTSMSRAAE